MLSLVISVFLLAATQAQGGLRPQVPAELQSYIEPFTGSDAVDCGRYLLDQSRTMATAEQLRKSVTCGSAAAKDRKPFLALVQYQGIDSLVFEGLLGTAEGKMHRFSYDSAPCGGPGCPGRFTIERCDKPDVTERGSHVAFSCAR
jgi:hypothetical protein